jgi:YbbR domain-containing protein
MKDLLLRNWHLKLIALVLATALWAQVARTPTSEIGVSVLLEYRNFPQKTEVYGDATNRVEVRLRGPSSLLRSVAEEDVSLSVDLSGMAVGQEKILPLSPDLVHAPFGVEVVRVNPARVRLTIEPTVEKTVRVTPVFSGSPKEGFQTENTASTPATVEIEGPESHVRGVSAISTTPVSLTGRNATFIETAELDIQDPVVRVPKATSVKVEIKIHPTKP